MSTQTVEVLKLTAHENAALHFLKDREISTHQMRMVPAGCERLVKLGLAKVKRRTPTRVTYELTARGEEIAI